MRRVCARVQASSDEANGVVRFQSAIPDGPIGPGWVEFGVDQPDQALANCQVAWKAVGRDGFGPPFELGRGRPERFFGFVRLPNGIEAIRIFPGFRGRSPSSLRITIRRASILEIAQRLLARGVRVAARNPVHAIRTAPQALGILLSKGSSALPRLGIAGKEGWRDDYPDWIRAREAGRGRAQPSSVSDGPLISVVTPVYRPNVALLHEAVESVVSQSYSNWTLVLVDDGSGSPDTDGVLDWAEKRDARISVFRRAVNGGISAATNDAVSRATGEFVAFFDQDDLLAPDALAEVAGAIAQRPSAAIIYSDQDKIDRDGKREEPFFKPDWDPDLILAQNYLNHLTVMRKEMVLKAGGLNSALDGAQDHDLILRVAEQVAPEDIVHVPSVLYHWRAIEGSTARAISEKPQVIAAATEAVSAALERRGVAATLKPVENTPYLRVVYPTPSPLALASIIIPTRDRPELLSQCLRSLHSRTAYKNYEVVIVDNGSVDQAAIELIESWRRERGAVVVRDDGDFNFSRLVNAGASASRGDVLVLLNNDIEVVQSEWLTELVSQAGRPGVGCVGAKLLFPDNTVQHAGVVLGLGGIAGHWQAGADAHDLGYVARLVLAWRPSAVTAACLATPRAIFERVGGFDEQLTVSFNDVDYCLRVRQAGEAIVWTPNALLKHHESASRGKDDGLRRAAAETEIMQSRWAALIASDPAFNINLSLSSQVTRLRL